MDKVNDIVKRNPLFACVGCPRAIDYDDFGFIRLNVRCSVYANPQQTYSIRNFGICPLNAPETIMTAKDKQKVRAGQQKSKQVRGG